jgi:hypothetical protein
VCVSAVAQCAVAAVAALPPDDGTWWKTAQAVTEAAAGALIVNRMDSLAVQSQG